MSEKIDFAVGGQAVIEGVMIRSPHFTTIAVRNPQKKIIVHEERFVSLAEKYRFMKLPLLRGVVHLIEMLIIGMRAINFSAEISLEDEEEKKEPQKKKGALVMGVSFAASVIFALAFGLFLFKFVPLFLTEQLQEILPALKENYLLFNLADGIIRIAIFLGYVFLLSLFKSFKRIFAYHGAEHMSIFAYEHGLDLTVENVKTESPRHPRCGTSFIMVVLIISIILFTVVPRHPEFFINFLYRLSIVPVIAAVGYEILKWSAKYRANPLVRAITLPGIVTQYITTKEPHADQIEVAIAALQSAIKLEAAFTPSPRKEPR